MQVSERIHRMSRQPTRYELAAHHPDGRRVLLCYTMRRSRSTLFDAVTDDRWIATVRSTMGTQIDFASRASDGARVGEWSIRWTGRTQRDAIQSGELPWIGGVA